MSSILPVGIPYVFTWSTTCLEAVQHVVDQVKTYGIPTGKIEDIVTSTSVLINGEAVQHAVDLVKTYGIPTGKIEDIVTSTSVR
jgi:chemotaxis signal transduction protein